MRYKDMRIIWMAMDIHMYLNRQIEQMKQCIILLAALGVFLLSGSRLSAQGTADDYRQAYSLSEKFSTSKVYHWAHDVAWKDSSATYHYYIDTPEGRRYIIGNADDGTTKVYATLQDMNTALGVAPRPSGNRSSDAGTNVIGWKWMKKTAFPVLSPDGKTEAYIEDYNVVLHEAGKPYTVKRIISQDGSPAIIIPTV